MGNNVPILNTNNAINLRPLVSYALSSYSMGQGSNYFDALIPIFAPIAIDNAGELFDSQSFLKEIKTRYDLEISPHAIDNFIQPMKSKGLLNETKNTSGVSIYRYATSSVNEDFETKHLEFVKKINALFESFHLYVSEMNTLVSSLYNKTQLEDGLIDWILKSDSKLELSCDFQKRPQSELDFIASSFLDDLSTANSEMLDDVALIHSGALMSELILDYKIPETSKKTFSDLRIVLDGPIVMQLLQLSGRKVFESTTNVLEQLKHMNIKVSVFKHSCEEIEQSINAILNPLNTNKTGPLAMALASGEVMEPYVRTVVANLEQKIEDIGIDIFDYDSYASNVHRVKYFTNEHKDRFYDSLNWENPNAKSRDAMSVSAIMQWRERTKVRDYFQSKYLFVTNNKILAHKARSFCIDEDLNKSVHAPPAITMTNLSGLLFLMLGDKEKVSLSRKQLLSNCGRAIIADPNIIEAFSDKLKELSPHNKDQIKAILSEPRTVQTAMNLTWGDPNVLTKDNVEHVIEELKETITKEQTIKYKDKIREVSEEKDRFANDNLTLRNKQNVAFERTVSKNIKIINILASSGVVLLVAASVFSIFLGDRNSDNIIEFGLYFFAGFVGLCINFLPYRFTHSKVVSLKKWMVFRELKCMCLDNLIEEFSIDWDSGVVNKKSETLFDTVGN